MDWFREVEELEKRVNFSRDIMIMDTVQWFTPCGYDAKNTSKLESNLDDLDKEMKSLIDLRSQVQRRVESSDEKQDTAKAEEWLEKAEKLEKSSNSIREREWRAERKAGLKQLIRTGNGRVE